MADAVAKFWQLDARLWEMRGRLHALTDRRAELYSQRQIFRRLQVHLNPKGRNPAANAVLAAEHTAQLAQLDSQVVAINAQIAQAEAAMEPLNRLVPLCREELLRRGMLFDTSQIRTHLSMGYLGEGR